jgi:hypothetical protein
MAGKKEWMNGSAARTADDGILVNGQWYFDIHHSLFDIRCSFLMMNDEQGMMNIEVPIANGY